MKCGILFSGGKDSTYAAYLAKQRGMELSCLISIFSRNKESYMFHTPSISQVKKQAKMIGVPFMTKRTAGRKELELKDLEKAIAKAKRKYKIDTLVTGALHSDYQASRIQLICDKLGLKCFNPLWHRNEVEYLEELVENKFKIIIVGVFAYPLDKKWLGREINKEFIEEVKVLKEKYKIHVAGEGGEFETFVIDCPLFSRPLKLRGYRDSCEGENAWRREIKVA